MWKCGKQDTWEFIVAQAMNPNLFFTRIAMHLKLSIFRKVWKTQVQALYSGEIILALKFYPPKRWMPKIEFFTFSFHHCFETWKQFFTSFHRFCEFTSSFPHSRTNVRVKVFQTFSICRSFSFDFLCSFKNSTLFFYFSMLYPHRWKILWITMKSHGQNM